MLRHFSGAVLFVLSRLLLRPTPADDREATGKEGQSAESARRIDLRSLRYRRIVVLQHRHRTPRHRVRSRSDAERHYNNSNSFPEHDPFPCLIERMTIRLCYTNSNKTHFAGSHATNTVFGVT